MDIVLGSIASLIGVGFSLELLLKSFRSKKPIYNFLDRSSHHVHSGNNSFSLWPYKWLELY